MLNACGLTTDDIEFVCDRNPLKQGRLMPGKHVPIVEPAKLLESGVDYCVLFVWNLADEVMRSEQAWLDRGGRFIVPIPVPKVLP
jgi:hypothetical protein